MKKPSNLKQRKAEDIMKPLKGVKLDSFGEVEMRGYGTARSLNNTTHLTMDWRLQWGDSDQAHKNRMSQVVEITMGKEKAIFSRQELERYLRHV